MGYDMMRTLLRLGRQKIKYEPWKDNNQDSDTTNLSLFASVSDKFVVLGFRCVDVALKATDFVGNFILNVIELNNLE